MQLRRSRALVAAALVLSVPLLASCGFNKATDKPYTPGEQTNNRTGLVDVLSAIIVAAQPNSGTFIASLANKSTTQTETFESVAGANGNAIIASTFKPVPIGPRGFVNLADGSDGANLGVPITGNFGAGDVIPLSLNFESGITVTLDVPVTYACQEYTGLDKSADSSPSASASPSTSPSETAGSSPSPSASSSPSATASPYVCGSSGGTGGRN